MVSYIYTYNQPYKRESGNSGELERHLYLIKYSRLSGNFDRFLGVINKIIFEKEIERDD